VLPQHTASGSAERSAQAGASDRFGDACKSGSAQAAAAAPKLSVGSDAVNAPPLKLGMNKQATGLYNG